MISDSVVHEHKMLSERGVSARGVETSVRSDGISKRVRVLEDSGVN